MDWRLKEEAVNTAIFEAILSLHKLIFIPVQRIIWNWMKLGWNVKGSITYDYDDYVRLHESKDWS